MELKKQGQILSLLLDERLIDYQVVVSWIDWMIQESEEPESWMTEISLAQKEDIDRIVYLLWTHFGYEYYWSYVEYVALIVSQYQKNDLPLHNCIIHLHHLAKDFHPDNADTESMVYKQKISYLFDILDSDGYQEESVEIVVAELDVLIRAIQEEDKRTTEFINDLIDQHSTRISEHHLLFHSYQAKPQ